MKKFLNEFNEFIARGNVIDLAVGIIIGGAFGKIITSLVEDIIMPPIGILISGVSFSNIKIILKESYINSDGKAIDAVALNIGNFLQIALNFIIVAFCIFLVIKTINRLKRIKLAEDRKPEIAQMQKLTKQEELLIEIRDLLKNK